ncbi:MAG: hypothetical protein ACSW8C_00160 [bacterium]
MTITLQTLKEFFAPSVRWEIDFRDVSITTKAALYSIKKVGGFVFSALTIVLGLWVGTNFIKIKTLEGNFQEIQNYVSTNETKNQNLLKINKSFYEEQDQVSLLVNVLSDGFDIQKFLQDLVQHKSQSIKYYEVIIQKEKRDLKQKKINLTVRLNGWVKEEIGLVETLKDEILKYPSLSQMPNCKSFFQLDNEQKSFKEEEIKFQLTVQSNE